MLTSKHAVLLLLVIIFVMPLYGAAFQNPYVTGSNTVHIIIAVQDTVAEQFSKYSENTPCHNVSLPTDHGPQRSFAELLLICNAFYATGVEVSIELFVTPSYPRSLRSVEQGLADISSESIWYSDINQELVYVSQAIAQNGEFEKGLYADENHAVFNQHEDMFVAENYSGVTVRSWEKDLQVLKTITPTYRTIHQYAKLFNVLSASRADFSLFPFSWGPEMTINHGNITLRPIPNVKVVMPGSRHITMSKTRPDARNKYILFKQGLKILKERGELENFLFESGMKNLNTQDWKILNHPT